ncbi:MAG: hypothetical protein M3319_16730, partial [Actinomycetota bacterium]|nr:hypothetical protein [Actinomycetota bacterium]
LGPVRAVRGRMLGVAVLHRRRWMRAASGSSVFGQASRSWLPPGTTCTYDLSDYGLPTNVVIRPTPLRLAVVGALVGLPALLHLRRLLIRKTPVNA